MKLVQETLHEIKIKNLQGEEKTLFIDLSDFIQTDAIVELFKHYESIIDLEIDDDMDGIKKLAKWQREANDLLDLAFGTGAKEMLLGARNPLTTQLKFVSFLEKEIESAVGKIDDYVKKVRKEALVNDHQDKDTI